MNKIHVYFMPGLAASSLIFERISLPAETFEIHLLEWIIPIEKESLATYSHRMSKLIQHENIVLVGVSFGGVVVQEMAQFLNLRKLIIISSIKTNLEMPPRMKVINNLKAYKLMPLRLLQNIEILNKFPLSSFVKQRLKIYQKYLSIRDKTYLKWSIEQMITWKRIKKDDNVIHIHGDSDEVFPIKNIKDCIIVKGGTHIMILNKYKWFNENLPKIILNEFN